MFNILFSKLSVWFSLVTPVSSTNKTDRHDIIEIYQNSYAARLNSKTQLLIKTTISGYIEWPLYTGLTVL